MRILILSFILFLALLSVIPAFAVKPTQIPTLDPGQPTPRLFLQSSSHGNQWNAARDQSIEMSKDFATTCPVVQITLNQANADYTVVLNHVEVGITRDNQMQIAAKNGDQLSIAEGGSIKARVKDACILILTDWKNKNPVK
jgi:hypothetical protein